MSGSTRKPFRRSASLKILVYRNCWITYGYYNISERLHRHIGENASWCTLALVFGDHR
jgi:hypothetical protein